MLQFEGTREYTAAVVHDLGNLIQLASSAVNILARNPRLNDGDLKPVIAGAQTSLRHASALVRQNLSGARGQYFVEVDVRACLSEIQELVRATWNDQFRVHMRIGPCLPKVRCDLIALQNAVLNLMLNARDAMPDGGDIAVGAIATVDGVEIGVADNGVGMTDETVRRAFDAFFTTKVGGLGGIGLPTVDRFAREAGGSVRVESKLGVGTIVVLQLPAADS